MHPTILNREFQHPADGWYQIEALGNHPNRAAGVVQVIDQAAAESIVNRFNADAAEGKLRHGSEMLIDHEHFSDQPDQETRAYGWLQQLQNRTDGIYAQIRWTKTGKEAVDGGDYRFFSTEYDPADTEVVGPDAGGTARGDSRPTDVKNRGMNLVRPLRLAGLSLTNMNNNRGQKPITNRDQNMILNGDKPGHEFHGNQYTAAGHVQSLPGYRKTQTDFAGVKHDFVHVNASTPRNAAESFTREARARGADERTRIVSSSPDSAEVVVHSRGEVHRVHFIKGYDQKAKNREDFSRGLDAEAETTTKNQRTKMSSVATKLGLSAEASEEAMLEAVTKLQNRTTELEGQVAPLKHRVNALETENGTLLQEQIEADFATAGIKDEKIVNRHKGLLADAKHFKNREERVAFIADLAKPAAGQKTEQRKLNNRDTKAPGGATVEGAKDEAVEMARAAKIHNRALAMQKETPHLSLATAYRRAQNEVEAANA